MCNRCENHECICGDAAVEAWISGQPAKKKLTPYQRIVRAAKKGVGVRLTADEVKAMSIDTAISELAENDDA